MTMNSTKPDGSEPVAGPVDQPVRPAAWMHPDGRVVPASTMDDARRDGGAMMSSLAGYTMPLYPPEALAAERERCARICEETWVEPGDLQTCNCQEAADKIRKS